MYINVLPRHMYVCCLCVWYLRKSEEGFRFPGTGATRNCDPSVWVLGIELRYPARATSTLLSY